MEKRLRIVCFPTSVFLIINVFPPLLEKESSNFSTRVSNPPFQYGRNAVHYGKLNNYFAMDEGNQIRGWGELRKAHWYFKVGRTTAVAAGICQRIEVYRNIIGIKHRTKYDETTMRPTLKGVDYTEELVMMNRVTSQAVGEQGDFC